jgi:type IV pilus assembly protein PilA
MGAERPNIPVADDPRSARPEPASIARELGFTLLEIMIVIGILAVLMVIALGAYGDYTKRTRMIEVMLAAGTCRNPVFEAYYDGKAPDAGIWGCESPTAWGEYVASIEVDGDGKVTVTTQGFNDPDIDGKKLTLVPIVDGDVATIADDKHKTLEWRCGSVDDGTTVPMVFLPATCR